MTTNGTPKTLEERVTELEKQNAALARAVSALMVQQMQPKMLDAMASQLLNGTTPTPAQQP